MRIGIDGIPLATPKTGIGHYTFELARSLATIAPEDEFEIIAPVLLNVPTSSMPPNLRTVGSLRSLAPAMVDHRFAPPRS